LKKEAVIGSVKSAYEFACFIGQISEANQSYKTIARILKNHSNEVLLYDLKRFESEIEAKHSPVGDCVIITKLRYKK
jgi:hypothetical protein